MPQNFKANLKWSTLIAAISLMTACSPTQDNGLLTDQKEDVCPAGCTDSLKADDNQIYLKIMNNVLNLPATTTRVDIGGECYASLFPKNRIEIAVYDDQNSSYYKTCDKVAAGADCYRYRGVDEVGNYKASCKNGRFNISLALGDIPTGRSYTVYAKIIGIDANNADHENTSDGLSFVKLRRAQ